MRAPVPVSVLLVAVRRLGSAGRESMSLSAISLAPSAALMAWTASGTAASGAASALPDRPSG